MTTVNFVTLSHSSAGYDSYDKLNRMFTGEKRRVVRSRIQDLTDYAPDQLQYMFKNDITCKSLFRVGMISFCSKHIRNAIQDFC